MNYVGVDLHKEQSWFYIMDCCGNKLLSKSVSNNTQTLKQFFARIPQPFELAVESTYNWYFFVDIAELYADKVFLANSYELKAFAKRHKKTDKIDAQLIADILRKGFLPAVFIPSKQIRTMKEILYYRINLVCDRSRNIFRLKNILDKLGENSSGNFTTYKQLNQLQYDHLPVSYKTVITGYIQRIQYLNKKISETEQFLAKQVSSDEDILNLRTLPGLDYFSSSLIKTEIADINRFRSFNRLCAYAGLAPRVSQSANKCFHGTLNKNRKKHLQWILLEVVYHFIKASPERKQRYEILKNRKGANTAKVIFARNMLKIIYCILKEQRPFHQQKENIQIQSVAAPALLGV